MITAILLILGAVAGVVFSGLVSAIETGAYTLSRVRLRVRAAQNYPGARALSALMERQSDVVLMALLGNTLSDYVGSACVTALLILVVSTAGAAEFWTTVILTPLLLTVGGIIPKEWSRREADRWMYPFAWPLMVLVRLARLTGFLWLMRRLTQVLVARFARGTEDEPLRPRAGALQLLHESAAAGGLSATQRDLIGRVMNLSQLRVTGVMIPRARIASIPETIRREEFLRIAKMAHFSRLPVWRNDPRNIVGVVYVFDVLTDPQQRLPAEHMRAPLFLPGYTRVSAALVRLQQARQPMGIVTDASGGCVGILTLKDLVEEIVGDLEVW